MLRAFPTRWECPSTPDGAGEGLYLHLNEEGGHSPVWGSSAGKAVKERKRGHRGHVVFAQ